MSSRKSAQLLQMEKTCETLLHELQIIWNEVGETDTEKDKMLFELAEECLEIYKKKVDKANRARVHLRKAIADSVAELAAICSCMEERPVHNRQPDQHPGSLKAELRAILPQLEEMRKRKCDRKNQFLDVLEQILRIRFEINMSSEDASCTVNLDETDLSSRKLEELHQELQALRNEKSERLKKILGNLNTLNSLCVVLGIDFKQSVKEIHPSLGESGGTKSISNETIEQLSGAIQRLQEVKIQRMQRLQELATSLLELWNLMDTPADEQHKFQNVTSNVAAAEDEITEPNMLSVDFINYVEAEVLRLEELKISKMKELVLKKRLELEDICRKTHMSLDSDAALDITIEAIESGAVDAGNILEQVELQIAKVKEEAFCRKEILDKVEKWMAVREEECWLEEYNRDENRYNAGRGAHLALKRAEKARVLVSKLSAMVEALASKVTAWENERGVEFTYDGIHLLSMLEQYTILQLEKELERKRQRDQKKLQGQLIVEQETLYGSKRTLVKHQSGKKGPRPSCNGGSGVSNRRLSLGGTTPKTEIIHPTKATPKTHQAQKTDRFNLHDQLNHPKDYGLSSGRRLLDVTGIPVKKHTFGAMNSGGSESPLLRKPFSPVSAADSSKSNVNNKLEDLNKKRDELLPKTLLHTNTPFTTPSKTSCAVGEENKTPKSMSIHTPSSALVLPMQTAVTPGPPGTFVPVSPKPVMEEDHQELEYSFEERRAAFMLSNKTVRT